ncbi:MAG: hypothetical protein J5I47_03050 [Vicingus serpentipes]|nr:hypothetical protein [Vicingus serpentipes]
MQAEKRKTTKYFGNYPYVNKLISKLVFIGIDYRRKQLIRKYKKNDKVFQLKNTEQTQKDFENYLNQGFCKINVGGGTKNFEGFVNIDFIRHENVAREVIANILDLSFIPDSCVTHIHSNHVMEHLTQQQLEDQLQQYQRILSADGIISIRVPNTLGVAYGFFFGQEAEREHEAFLKLGYPKEEDFYNPADGWYYQDLWALYHWFYAFTGNIENEHLNQITPTKLKDTVEKTGFTVLKMTIPEASNIVLMAKK